MKTCNFLSLLTFLLLSCNGTLALSRSKSKKIVTCYVGSWAIYRPSNGKFEVSNIDPNLCTHIVYSFAGLNSTSWTIRSLDPDLDIHDGNGNYKKVTNLRQKNSELNVLLAIGGWNEGSKNYSELASSPERRNIFINSVVDFLKKYDFDGLDLDWEFPGSWDGLKEDKENFVSLVKELKEAFKGSNYLLTAALSADIEIINKGYDIPKISKYLDYMNIMTYDYHGSWDKKVLPNAPLKSENSQNVMATLNYLLNKGAPANKLVLGLPMYGRTFILINKLNSPQESPINQPTESDGFKGPYTRTTGFIGYNEICEELMNKTQRWVTGWDDNSNTPYMTNEKHVIVFDNVQSFEKKIEYAMSLNLSGVMLWSIDTDDFNGKCASLNNSVDPTKNTYPLLRFVNTSLSKFNNYDEEDDNNDNKNNNNNDNNNSSFTTRFSPSFLLILVFFVHYI
ncbi:putative chitinase 2 [Lasioglossum baleicum]|uniref:putative chitinase 2 n=1 Tax=Lasioglossum baleicum TaxID=434251 RepID=UPI003FCCE618